MTNFDDLFLKAEKIRNSGGDYYITLDGYESADSGIMSGLKRYSKDMGIGARRGINKAVEGITGGLLAVLEKANVVSDGSVQKFSEKFDEIYETIGETETLAGSLTEGVVQYGIPGGPIYKGMTTFLKSRGVASTMARLMATESATVAAVQTPDQDNITSAMAQLLKIDPEQARGEGTLVKSANAVFNYIISPEVDQDADAVLSNKLKAALGDSIVIGPAGQAIQSFAKTFRKARKNPELREDLINELSLMAVNRGEM